MRSLVITIPIGEHEETIETLYKIGVKMKVAANQIFVDCVNGCLPEALTEIDRDFAVEVTADRSDRWDEPEINLQNHIQELGSRTPTHIPLIVSENLARNLSELYIASSFVPKEDSCFEIPTFEVMG